MLQKYIKVLRGMADGCRRCWGAAVGQPTWVFPCGVQGGRGSLRWMWARDAGWGRDADAVAAQVLKPRPDVTSRPNARRSVDSLVTHVQLFRPYQNP
jgi:hypothetical protein